MSKKNSKTRELMGKLETAFESKINIPRIKVGKKQTIKTLINEEVFLFAKYLRNEQRTWTPRLGLFCYSVLPNK
jgi:hypothetical protein